MRLGRKISETFSMWLKPFLSHVSLSEKILAFFFYYCSADCSSHIDESIVDFSKQNHITIISFPLCHFHGCRLWTFQCLVLSKQSVIKGYTCGCAKFLFGPQAHQLTLFQLLLLMHIHLLLRLQISHPASVKPESIR